jgi:hypothetical protein
MTSETFAERRAKAFKHLLRGIERNAANEVELTSHGMSFACQVPIIKQVRVLRAPSNIRIGPGAYCTK